MKQQEDIHWKQRFHNFKNAFYFLNKAISITTPNAIEEAGIIQAYEFTFELAWKTLKDYLETNSVIAQLPSDVLKEAFRYGLIHNGDTWLDMLDKRKLIALTHMTNPVLTWLFL